MRIAYYSDSFIPAGLLWRVVLTRKGSLGGPEHAEDGGWRAEKLELSPAPRRRSPRFLARSQCLARQGPGTPRARQAIAWRQGHAPRIPALRSRWSGKLPCGQHRARE